MCTQNSLLLSPRCSSWLVLVARASIFGRIIAKTCATSFCRKDIFVSKQAKLQRNLSPALGQDNTLVYCIPAHNWRQEQCPSDWALCCSSCYFIHIFKIYYLTMVRLQNNNMQIFDSSSSKLCSEKCRLMKVTWVSIWWRIFGYCSKSWLEFPTWAFQSRRKFTRFVVDTFLFFFWSDLE